MKYLLIILLFWLSSCFYHPHQITSKIVVKEGWVLTKMKLNDKDAWFLLDTGASGFSMLNYDDSLKYGFSLSNNFEIISGIGGYSYSYYVNNIDLYLEKTKIEGTFVSHNLNHIFKGFENKTGIHVIGIIGSGFFIKYKAIINYKNNTVIFTK